MSQIVAKNLTFAYPGGENIFENVNFTLDTDWKIGLIGRNGRGKTTFLNLLLKNMEYSGEIISSTSFDYFPYEVKNKQKQIIETVYDIYPDADLWEVIKKMEEFDLAEDKLYEKFSDLSGGEQTKILLAILFSKGNNFLLIDEPTNFIDYETKENIKNFLAKQKGFILVSHDRNFIDGTVDHILSLNRSNIDVQKGNFSSWWSNKQNNDKFEINKNEKLKKEIKRLNESALQRENWSNKVESTKNGTKISGLRPDKGYIGHKSAKMMKSSKVLEERKNAEIEEKSKLLKNIERDEDLFLNGQEFDSEKSLIEFKDVSISYGDKVVVKNFSLNIKGGEKYAICGKNGSGKSTILKLVTGQELSYKGDIFKNSQAKISYIPQMYDFGDETPEDFAVNSNIDKTRFFILLSKLGVESDQFKNKISELSEGQKKKILIAKSFCENANFYVWDEPLTYVDVISRIQIENILKETNIALLIVEHDFKFLESIGAKMVNL